MEQTDVVADAKGRINLGLHRAKQRFLIIEQSENRVVLERAALVPQRDLSLYQSQMGKPSAQNQESSKNG